MSTDIILAPSYALSAPQLFTPTAKAAKRVLEFFTAQVNNDHTRRAYLNATRRFSAWCETHGLHELSAVQPFHVAAFVKELQGQFAPPTVKQHLAALRMLFDWLVTGHIIETNPAHAVRGPKYVVKKGKTPVLTAEEARTLLDAIPTDALTGLRDRALIGVMVFTFARVNAVIEMKVKDYFTQGRAVGCACTRRAVRSTRCPAITAWSGSSMITSQPPASPAIPMDRCFGRPGARPARYRPFGNRMSTG